MGLGGISTKVFFNAKGAEGFWWWFGVVGVYREGRGGGLTVVGADGVDLLFPVFAVECGYLEFVDRIFI
jgi:hypothetical protein